MAKTKFTTEYEINASSKMLYPYLSSSSGLADWFADKVTLESDKVTFNFIWDGKVHKAKKVSQKINQYVKFEFLPEKEADKKDLSYIEFKIDTNELTQTSFLRITDYSEIDDPKDLKEMWNNLLTNLKVIVGG